MSLKLVVILLAVVGLVGIAVGYFLRWLIALSKKGSMELEIKKKLLNAEEEAKKITKKADAEATKIVAESRSELKEREEKSKTTEDRLIKKEDLLDNRQSVRECGALFISCTNLHAMQVVDELERELDVPVVTSNSATLWFALHRLGIATESVSAGRLFGVAPAGERRQAAS